jgi:putative addiction module component (TIGR02574 family)
MHAPSPLHRYTYADYVGVELTSSTKHEFLDGEIYAMAGGSEEHSALCAQVLRLLGNAIAERPCQLEVAPEIQAELDRRLAAYRRAPDDSLSWDEVQRRVREGV